MAVDDPYAALIPQTNKLRPDVLGDDDDPYAALIPPSSGKFAGVTASVDSTGQLGEYTPEEIAALEAEAAGLPAPASPLGETPATTVRFNSPLVAYDDAGIPDYSAALNSSEGGLGESLMRGLFGRGPDIVANMIEAPATVNEAVIRATGATPSDTGLFAGMRGALRKGAGALRELGYTKDMDAVGYGNPTVSGGEVVDAINPTSGMGLGDRASAVGTFIPETLAGSVTDMAATLNPLTLVGYMTSRTNEVAKNRAANDNRADVTLGDVGVAAPAAVLEALLERFTTMRLLPHGTTMATPGVLPAIARVAKELGIQGTLGGVEELAPYLAEGAGTETGVTGEGALETFVGGALAEGVLGGGAQGIKEVASAVRPAHIPTATVPPNALMGEAAALGEVPPAPIAPQDAPAPLGQAEDTSDIDTMLAGVLGDPEIASALGLPPSTPPADAVLGTPVAAPAPGGVVATPDPDAAFRRPELESAPVATPSPVADPPIQLPEQTLLPDLGEQTTAQSVQALPTQSAPAAGSADLTQAVSVAREAAKVAPRAVPTIAPTPTPLQLYHQTSADTDFQEFRGDRPTFFAANPNGASKGAMGQGRLLQAEITASKFANTPETPVHFLDVSKTFAENPDAEAIYVADESGVSVAVRDASKHAKILGRVKEKRTPGQPSTYSIESEASLAPSIDEDTPDPPANIAFGKRRATEAATGDTARAQARVDRMFPSRTAPESEQLESLDAGAEASRTRGSSEAESLGLRAAVDEALGKVGEKVIFLHGLEGLPEKQRKGIQARAEKRGGKGRTAALFDPATKNVYVFTDVVRTADRAVWNALHEVAGHEGLRTLLGDGLNRALDIALQNPTVMGVAEAIAAERNLDMSTEAGRLLAAEEALAELAAAVRTGNFAQIESRYKVPVPEGIRERLTRAIDDFLKRLKAAMEDVFGRHQFSDEDVRALLENAWQAVNQDGRAANGEPLESVEDPGAIRRRTPADAQAEAEIKRNVVAGTLPVSRGTPGWNYDSGAWEGRKGELNRARTQLQDKMLPWREAQNQIESQLQAALPDAQNVYRIENLMHGRVSEGIDRIERDQIVPLVDAMKARNVKPAELEEYLYARHAKERNAQIAEINPKMPDGGSGMTNADADKILAAADKEKLDPLAKRVDAITRSTRKRLLDSGLITQEQFDGMQAQYSAYVPLRGKATKETDFDAGTGGAGRGVDSRAQPVKAAMGRGAGNRAENILGEVIGDAQRSVIVAEKARVGRAVMRIVLANPNPNLWTVEPVQTERKTDANGEVYDAVVNDWSDPSIVAVRHKGKLYKVEIQNQPMAQALNNVGIDQLGTVTRAASAINRYLSAVLTKYNPAFVPVNATRDALFGLTGLAVEKGETVALEAALSYPKAAIAAGRSAANKPGSGEWDAFAKEFAEAGGKTGYVNAPSAEDLARKIGSGKLTSYSPDGLMKAARAIGDAIEVLNDAVENALRLSAYGTLRKRGESVDAAAEYAKNLTVNFNRKGLSGSKLNAWFLFYNAALQGAHRTSKLLRKPKTYAYLGVLAGAQVIATMAAMGMEDDNGEPLWNKIPDHVKRRNLVIPLPSGHIITVPMPYGFNLFTYMSGRIAGALANNQRGDDRPSDAAGAITADLMSAATESFLPVPLGDGAMGMLPTVLRVPVNVQTNRDDFGRPIRDEDAYAKSDVPRASMGKPDTLELFKITATGLNRLGGGDDLTPPAMSWFDRAPEDLEYLLGEITGGTGQFIVDTAKGVQKATGDDPITMRDIPITKRFVTSVDEQAAQAAMFYDRRETIDRSLKRVRILFEQDGEQAAEAMLKATPELKGAAFKRRKGEGKKGQAIGSVVLVDGRPQIVVGDEDAVYGRYKAAEKAITARNEAVEAAYANAPKSIIPTAGTRERDAGIRTSNDIREAAQSAFNEAWVRDVVGAAE